jgi:hypothetical protein
MNRTREYIPDSRGKRDRYQRDESRPSGNISPRQSGPRYPRQEPPEFQPEAAQVQSMNRPQSSRQLAVPKDNRSRNIEQPRDQAPTSDSFNKKTDSGNSKRKGLRSLGDG